MHSVLSLLFYFQKLYPPDETTFTKQLHFPVCFLSSFPLKMTLFAQLYGFNWTKTSIIDSASKYLHLLIVAWWVRRERNDISVTLFRSLHTYLVRASAAKTPTTHYPFYNLAENVIGKRSLLCY